MLPTQAGAEIKVENRKTSASSPQRSTAAFPTVLLLSKHCSETLSTLELGSIENSAECPDGMLEIISPGRLNLLSISVPPRVCLTSQGVEDQLLPPAVENVFPFC